MAEEITLHTSFALFKTFFSNISAVSALIDIIPVCKIHIQDPSAVDRSFYLDHFQCRLKAIPYSF